MVVYSGAAPKLCRGAACHNLANAESNEVQLKCIASLVYFMINGLNIK